MLLVWLGEDETAAWKFFTRKGPEDGRGGLKQPPPPRAVWLRGASSASRCSGTPRFHCQKLHLMSIKPA